MSPKGQRRVPERLFKSYCIRQPRTSQTLTSPRLSYTITLKKQLRVRGRVDFSGR